MAFSLGMERGRERVKNLALLEPLFLVQSHPKATRLNIAERKHLIIIYKLCRFPGVRARIYGCFEEAAAYATKSSTFSVTPARQSTCFGFVELKPSLFQSKLSAKTYFQGSCSCNNTNNNHGADIPSIIQGHMLHFNQTCNYNCFDINHTQRQLISKKHRDNAEAVVNEFQEEIQTSQGGYCNYNFP